MTKKPFLNGSNHFKITIHDGWCEYNQLNEVLQSISNLGWNINFVDNGNISCTKKKTDDVSD